VLPSGIARKSASEGLDHKIQLSTQRPCGIGRDLLDGQLDLFHRSGLVAIAERLALPRNNLSFHLKSPTAAGLVKVTQEGRYQRYRADLEALQGLIGYLTEACCADDTTTCDLDSRLDCDPVDVRDNEPQAQDA
jgi:DNA-binding transcriptional ArsR family regulator